MTCILRAFSWKLTPDVFIQQHCNVILLHRDHEDASFNLEAPATYTNKMMTVFHQDPGTLQNGCHQSSNYTSSPYVIRYTLAYLATVQLALRLLRTIFLMQFDSSFYQGVFKDYTLSVVSKSPDNVVSSLSPSLHIHIFHFKICPGLSVTQATSTFLYSLYHLLSSTLIF